MPTRQHSRIGQDFGKVVEDLARLLGDLATAALSLTRRFIEEASRRPESSRRLGDSVARPNNWNVEGLAAARASGEDLTDWALANTMHGASLMDLVDDTIEDAQKTGVDVESALRRVGFQSLDEVMASLDDRAG